jgi:2-polyprenyl-3-methyl-5-hydroxy-6-metoxy-1,4-benzoquinol methylase
MMQTAPAFTYSGDELTVFAAAIHWKAYWSAEIAPWLGARILELGAGIGATAKALIRHPHERWLGLEPDAAMCRQVEEEIRRGAMPAPYEIRCGTSQDLPPGELFDTALYIDVLEHIEDDRGELERAARHLTPGGHIVIVAPAHNFLYTEFDRKIGHFRRYDQSMLRACIPPSLKLCKLRYLDSVGTLASLANKLLLKSDTPQLKQIRLWDTLMVPLSRRVLDPLLFYRLGKSLVCVLQAP